MNAIDLASSICYHPHPASPTPNTSSLQSYIFSLYYWGGMNNGPNKFVCLNAGSEVGENVWEWLGVVILFGEGG